MVGGRRREYEGALWNGVQYICFFGGEEAPEEAKAISYQAAVHFGDDKSISSTRHVFGLFLVFYNDDVCPPSPTL